MSLILKKKSSGNIATPATGKSTFFIDSVTGLPQYKDETGTVGNLQGPQGPQPPLSSSMPQTLIVAGSGAAGSSTSASASDHVHPVTALTDSTHGNRLGGVLHANATSTLAGFMPSNLFNKLGNMFVDVKADNGAIGDGIADDTAAIQAAINKASGVRGLSVFFPTGVYKLTSTLTMPSGSNNLSLIGADRGSVALNPNFASGDCIQLLSGSDMITIRDLSIIQGATTKTSGAGINTNGASDIIIQNVHISGQFIGVAIQGNSFKVKLTNALIDNVIAATGVAILINNGSVGDTYIGPSVIVSNNPASKPLAGIQILATGHTSILECNVTSCLTGLLVNPGVGQVVNYLFVDHTLLDSCGTNGINLNATTATSVIESVVFVNSWASGTTSGGGAGIITQGVAGGIIDDVTFSSCRILNNQTHGMQHGFGNNFFFKTCTIAGNSQASSGVNDGINIAANINKFFIIGNIIGTGGTSQVAIQRFGVNVLSGASNNYEIINNSVLGNVTAGISDLGSPVGLTQKSVKDNIGCSLSGGISSTTVASAGINTTETIIVGGLNNCVIPANALKVGTVIRITMPGSCTTTAANVSTFTLRMGVNGTIADASVATAAVTAATSGTVLFKAVMEFIVTAVGTTGTILGNLNILNGAAITGISTLSVFNIALTTTATLNTTVSNYLEVTYKSAATTTTSTFSAPCYIQVVKS